MNTARASGGFSLLEILIAFIGVAMLLGVLIRLFDNGLETMRIGERYTRATVIAQSKLAQAGVERRLEKGVTSGMAEEIFNWRMSVSDYSDAQAPAPPRSVRPLAVQVDVFWDENGETHVISLTSILLRTVRS